MAKGSVITQPFVEALGLAAFSHVLSSPVRNMAHPDLLDPMFHIHLEEFPDTVYLDRQYCFDHQFSFPPGYGQGKHILLWMSRATRHRNNDPEQPAVTLLLVSDCFLYDEPREFQRFRLFLKSKRILDSQARDFLARFGDKFPDLVGNEEGLGRILDCLGNIAEWPDPENGFRKRDGTEGSLESLAKTWSGSLAKVRSSERLVQAFMRRQPEQRLNIFRLLCFVEDQEHGGDGLLVFLRDIGQHSGVTDLIKATAKISSGPELGRALEAVRTYLSLPV